MKRYNWYILRQLAGSFVFITLGLSAAVWLTQSLRFVDLIVNKGLSIQAFLHLTLLLLPSFFGVIGPLALFFAVLYTYNKLIRESELVTLRAAGLSPAQLGRPAFVLAGVVVVLVYSMTLYFMPAGFRAFKDQQFIIRSDYSGILLQEGVFTSLMDNVTVYVRARKPNGELLGILVHDERIADEPITMMAERGALIDVEGGPRFVMINGNRQQVDQEDGRLSLLYFDRYTLDLGTLSADPSQRWREPRERFLGELFNPTDSADDQKNHDKFLAEAHQRLVSPLFTVVFVCIAFAALFSGEFNRRGQWRRLLAAVIAGFAFEAVALGLQNVVAKSPALTPLIYVNVITVAALGFYILRGGRPLDALARLARRQPVSP